MASVGASGPIPGSVGPAAGSSQPNPFGTSSSNGHLSEPPKPKSLAHLQTPTSRSRSQSTFSEASAAAVRQARSQAAKGPAIVQSGPVHFVWFRYLVFTNTVAEVMRRSFYALGIRLGERPYLVILACLLVTSAMSMGMLVAESETEVDKLWIPQESVSIDQKAFVEGNYGFETRRQTFIITGAGDPGTDILDKDHLLAALDIHNEIIATEQSISSALAANNNGSSVVSFQDVCYKPLEQFGDPSCQIFSILSVWDYDAEAIRNDPDIRATVDAAGLGEDMRLILGSRVMDVPEAFAANFTDGTIITAFRMAYITESDREVLSEAWEQAYLDVVEQERDLIDVYYAAERSVADELTRALGGDLFLFALAFLLMILYTMTALGKLDAVHSKMWLALVGVATVGISTISGFGFCSLIGVPFTSISQVVPFIVLGIGVDDMFILVNSFERTDRAESIPRRLGLAMEHAGVSVFITSVSDVLAFAAGSSTSLPAVAFFCINAAVIIFVDFVLQITLFCAFLALDARRVKANRRDCCPCCISGRVADAGDDNDDDADDGLPGADADAGHGSPQVGHGEPMPEKKKKKKRDGDLVRAFMEVYYAPALTKMSAKAVVVVVFVVVFGLAVWQAPNLESGLDISDITPTDSYLIPFFDATEDHFPTDRVSVGLYFQDFDYRNDAETLDRILNDVQQLRWTQPTASGGFWTESFRRYLAAGFYLGGPLGPDGFPESEEDYYVALDEFLESPFGILSVDDIVFDTDNTCSRTVGNDTVEYNCVIASSRFWIRHVELDSARDQANALENTRQATRAIAEAEGVDMFAYSSAYVFWEQWTVLNDETIANLMVAGVTVVVVTLVFLIHPAISVFVAICLVMIDFDLLALMVVWDVQLNAVSASCLVLAVGLAVDAIAHVSHAFVSSHGTRDEKLWKSLSLMGSSVLNGTLTTFIGVMVLSFGQSKLFQIFFRMFTGILILSLSHGLIFLPVLMSLIGPTSDPPEDVDDDDLQRSMAEIPASLLTRSITQEDREMISKLGLTPQLKRRYTLTGTQARMDTLVATGKLPSPHTSERSMPKISEDPSSVQQFRSSGRFPEAAIQEEEDEEQGGAGVQPRNLGF